MKEDLTKKTIADFGDQWTSYRENTGYYASVELLEDLCSPFLKPSDFYDKKVADVGSGTGRIVNMLLMAGARHVIAIEPSRAFEVLLHNTLYPEKVFCIHAPGEDLPRDAQLDFAVSFGVLHHIPDPAPVVKAMYNSLKPGGQILVWLYGREGNRSYLFFVQPLRFLTQRLPHKLLDFFCLLLLFPLNAYIALCDYLPLPMKKYMNGHLKKLSNEQKKLTIYDQLNPAYAKYYSQSEARALLENAGFDQVTLHHRHGYSWTVTGFKKG